MTNSCCETESSCGCSCAGNRENKLCELTKPHNQFDMEQVVPLVKDPKYICRCCGRMANSAENLCNPIELSNK